jgi:hypothetical protein
MDERKDEKLETILGLEMVESDDSMEREAVAICRITCFCDAGLIFVERNGEGCRGERIECKCGRVYLHPERLLPNQIVAQPEPDPFKDLQGQVDAVNVQVLECAKNLGSMADLSFRNNKANLGAFDQIMKRLEALERKVCQ